MPYITIFGPDNYDIYLHLYVAIFQDAGFSGPWYEVGLQLFTHITPTVSNPRGQALVKNSKRPPDFSSSNIHSPTQDPIALDFLNASVPQQFFSKNNSWRRKLSFHCSIAYWSCTKGQLMSQMLFFNWFYYWYCSEHDLKISLSF